MLSYRWRTFRNFRSGNPFPSISQDAEHRAVGLFFGEQAGVVFVVVLVPVDDDVFGGRNQTVLDAAEAAREVILLQHIANGVIIDSRTVQIAPDVVIAPGAVILAGTILRGRTVIGAGCIIGPNTLIEDSIVDEGSTVNASQVYSSHIGPHNNIGPFTHVRVNTVTDYGVHLGAYVETKNSNFARGNTVSHLTYIGDSDVGKYCNFGCGTVTCNYDGKDKFRTQIGDYNRALDDFDRVALYSPGNVQVYYLRAMLKTRLGDLEGAERDYTRAIELYPDFANAYLNRSALRYALHNPKAAKRDEEIAQRKIAEYKSHLKDSTYSIYADTTQRMDKLLAFDNQFTNNYFDRISEQPSLGRSNMRLLPLFRFTLMQPDTSRIEASNRYTLQRVKDFEKKLDNPYLVLSNRPTNIDADSLAMLDSRYAEILCQNPRDWLLQVQYAISQSLIRQFTNSVGAYSSAIADNAANPFLYFNRAVTRAEMIDFISGLDNPYQRISIDSDPANKLTNTHTRTYNYDEAIADLDKTLRLFPNFAEAYYNRGTLLALSGKLPEAFEDFSRAIELNPLFAEAFYNRGMTQIYMKDTRKGCLDLSKAGELGITSAYEILKRYTGEHTEAF